MFLWTAARLAEQCIAKPTELLGFPFLTLVEEKEFA